VAGQPDDAQHRAAALLGVRAGRQDLLRQRRRGRPGPGSARLPSSFWNGRALISAAHPAMAALASPRLVSSRPRSRAMIHRPASSTPPSALALSFGLHGRAGITATP
jgi:hypothetical protein